MQQQAHSLELSVVILSCGRSKEDYGQHTHAARLTQALTEGHTKK